MKSQSICGNLAHPLMKVADILNVLVPSSAGLERIFSIMGFICDSKKKRLDPEKHKLVFCYKLLQELTFSTFYTILTLEMKILW